MGKKMILLLVTLLCGCGESHCRTEDSCINDPQCQCWCSQKCGYRKKTASDHPVYVEKDANGKTCYCKQWDLDNYVDNCEMNMRVIEPKDAK